MLFKCLRSGNTVNIDQQDDIDRMMTHEGYAKVVTHEVPFDVISEMEIQDEIQETHADADEAVEDAQEAQVLKVVKQRGRPKKVVVPVEDVAEI